MNTAEVEDASARFHVPAAKVLDEVAACGLRHIFAVPDFVTLSVHSMLRAGYLPDTQTIECCSEDEAVTAAAGVWIGGAPPAAVMMQNQGLHACMNTLRACGLDASFPFMLMIGQFGREEANLGGDPSFSRRLVVRVTEPLLAAYDIPYFRLETTADLPVIGDAYRAACRRSGPSAVLFGWATAWDAKPNNGGSEA